MRDFTIAETLLAKKAYEKLVRQAGHQVKHYRADNGRFADKAFHQSVNENDQTLDFCGVGAHHQNGLIENRNKALTLGARTLLLHGMRMWPKMITTMFWPFAMKAFAERMNSLHMDSSGETPESKMYGVPSEGIPVKNFHTLFCPVYVLDARLQSAGGAGPPKWDPRARIGVYLGHSPMHAGNVALVFNPKTGHVSPQYHVTFDDEFTTVPYMERGEVPPNWDDLYWNSSESAPDEEFDKAVEWISGAEDVGKGGNTDSNRITDPFAVVPDQLSGNANSNSTETDVTSTLSTASEGERSHSSPSDLSKRQAAAANEPDPKRQKNTNDRAGARANLMDEFELEAAPKEDTSAGTSPNESLFAPTCVNLHEAGWRRSNRIKEREAKKVKAHVTYGTHAKRMFSLFTLLCTVSEYSMPKHKLPQHSSLAERILNRFEEANEHCDGTLNEMHAFAFATDAGSNEVFTYHQAQKQKDWHMFVEAMEKEIADHEQRHHWDVVPRSSIPTGTKVIKAIWSFKRKRFPDGRLNKHKARICAHGGMQRWGDNYWETYSPVINTISVKLLLVIAKVHGLDSKAIDFVLAFPQAELDVDIWMDLPIGFEPIENSGSSQYVLKLRANLYGLKQGSHNWYKKLRQGLLDREFKSSDIDQCLYLKDGMIVLTYVDDCIIVGNSMKEIDEFIESMKNGPENFILTDEGDINTFLGVEIKHRNDEVFEMSQPHLIDRILSFLQLEHNGHDTSTKERITPAASKVLNKALEGKPRKKTWKYRTAVGMLSYLQANTRPDVSMATHQKPLASAIILCSVMNKLSLESVDI
jgi:hypothetical protein